MKRLWPLLVATAASWAIWPWLWTAYTGPGADHSGLVALILCVALFFSRSREGGPAWAPSSALLVGAAVAIGSYAALWNHAPRLVAAGFAAVGLGCTLIYALPPRARAASAAVPLLVVLALPLGPSLDFAFGYALRLATAHGAVVALRLGGVQAGTHGTGLVLDGRAFFVDPACAGVQIAWTALLVAVATAAFRGLRLIPLAALTLAAIVMATTANAARSAVLVAFESRLGAPPEWLHEGIGLLAFAGVAAALIALGSVRSDPCEA